MVSKDKIIELTNRDHGSVGYRIPDLNIHRTFSAGETKKVTFNEIEQLSWVDGGKALLKHYLIIQDPEAAEEILGEVQPEYFYTQKDVKKLLTEGTLDQLKDTLEYGPKGVIDLVKQEAVELKLNNNAMREEIQKTTHFNVTNAINNDLISKENNENEAATTQRRSEPITATKSNSTTSGRRSEPITESKYKVVSKN
jgi:hypothetical protein